MVSRERKVTVSFYLALVKSHLEHCLYTWGSQHKKDVDLLKQIQQRAVNMI